jgi:hypothetical protein
MVGSNIKFTNVIIPFWKRDGFASLLHYKAAKKGKVLRQIIQDKDGMRDHPEYVTALAAEKVGLIKA